MTQVEKNMAVSALAQLLDQQPTAYAEVLAACRAMGWNASPTAQPQDLIDELPSNVVPFIRRMLALLIYGDGSADSPAVVPVTERCYAQMVPRVTSPNYPAAGFPSDPSDPFLPMSPTRRDFAHLPQALSALADRKMVPGLYDANGNELIVDGMSLIRYLASDTSNMRSQVARIIDNNYGWTITSNIFSQFPNVTYAELGFDKHLAKFYLSSSSLEELHLRLKQTIVGHYNSVANYRFPNAVVYADELTSLTYYSEYGADWCYWIDCKELYIRGLREIRAKIVCRSAIQKVVFGIIDYVAPNDQLNSLQFIFNSCPDLIHIEFERLNCSFDMSGWSPTNALDASRTDLIEEGSTAQNNLDQFLQNFRDHIALRLTDQGSGKTLTLSQAVYDAIKDETHLFVFDEGTMTIYAYLTNIKHWTVTK